LSVAKQEHLLPALNETGFLLDRETYTNAGAPLEDFLLEIPDFSSLIAVSQVVSKPVFALDQEDIGSSGVVFENQDKSIQDFNQTYHQGAQKIIKLTNG
jgi:hypothetical protein